METKEQTKINWGGLVETVENLPDGKDYSPDNADSAGEYLSMLKKILIWIEESKSYNELYRNLYQLTKKDCNYLCSPFLDSVIKLSVERAAEDNNMGAVRFLIERGIKPSNTDTSLAWACAHQNIEMLNYLIPYHTNDLNKIGVPLSVNKACETCVTYDSLDCLKILVQKYTAKYITYDAVSSAFFTNNMRFIEYFHSAASSAIITYLRNENMLISVKDNLEAIHFLVSNNYIPLHKIPNWTSRAAMYNLIRIFKYLVSVNPDIKDSIPQAIKYGQMRIVKYVIEEMKQPITIEYMKAAIDHNSDAFIRYFLEQGAQHIEEALFYAVSNKKMKIAELLRLELCRKSYV